MMTSTERRQRRERIADALDGAGYPTQAAATRAGYLLPRVPTAEQRAEVEQIHRSRGVDIAGTWGAPDPPTITHAPAGSAAPH